MEEKEMFQWEVEKPWLVFPIDYTSRECEKMFNLKSKGFREHVLTNDFFRDTLSALALTTENRKFKNRTEKRKIIMPPIPLEAMPLLECFYKLTYPRTSEYHQFFFSSDNYPHDVMERFWTDLCVALYKKIAPPQDRKVQDTYACCRHMLFMNEQFTASLIAPLWEQEIVPRYNEAKKLAAQVNSDIQMAALRDCLFNFDRIILNLRLQSIEQSNQNSVMATPESFRTLLESLVSFRQEHLDSTDELTDRPLSYTLPNWSLTNGNTMEYAFADIKRQGKAAIKTAHLLEMARESYLSHLAENIETNRKAKGSPNIEQKYIDLCNYLDTPSSQETESLHDLILESCKRYCQQVIDNCTSTPNFDTSSQQHTSPRTYRDELLGIVISGYIGQEINHFQSLIQMVSYHHAGQSITNYNGIYESNFLQYVEGRIKTTVHSEDALASTHLALKESQNDNILIPVDPLKSINVFSLDSSLLVDHMQAAWDYLYGNRTQIVDLETHQIQDISQIADVFWEKGSAAARFFSRVDLAFTSQQEASNHIDNCNFAISNPDLLISPKRFWANIAKIYQVLLLMVLRKIVDDSIPILLEYTKLLL